ncbi:CAP domain-containing protein [Thalassobacillus pellis]|uniref:CAP domain-containing protein n=1 Tax=Thalassobacillus pellis TaxID=748008 RepID=UPI00195FCF4B|nr:CAP domain-containing protein [Thalassobacillus pellis]MBM7552881.1 uncharacterized protein YkwD [Thalassobacillus pellis]
MNLLRLLVLLLLAGGVYLIVDGGIADKKIEQGIEKGKEAALEVAEMLEESQPDSNSSENKETLEFKGSLYQWIGKDEQSLIEAFGEPARKDASAYGFEWWIYNKDPEKYLQFGVQKGNIVTWFVTGKDLEAEPLSIGQDYASVQSIHEFKQEVTYTDGIEQFTFQLTEEDMKSRPLVKLSDSVYAQLYFDTFTQKLSSIRVMNAEVLLKQQPYRVTYRGELPDNPAILKKEWAAIENGREKQIFDITNRIRLRFGKEPVKWYEPVAEVAFLHSKDMSINNYFSHYGQDGTGLKERLEEGKVTYVRAGENIAAQYPDAAAAVEGWLNSKGHREALLHEGYTHLGVGVYQDYYTQNFLALP